MARVKGLEPSASSVTGRGAVRVSTGARCWEHCACGDSSAFASFANLRVSSHSFALFVRSGLQLRREREHWRYKAPHVPDSAA